MRSFALFALTIVLLAGSFASAAAAPHKQFGDSGTLVVRPGDTWSGIRSRLYPVDALLKANPALARRTLVPGDVIRSPFVTVTRMEEANSARARAERELEETSTRLTRMEAQVADYEALQLDLASEKGKHLSASNLAYLLGLGTFALLGLLAMSLVALFATHKRASGAERQLRQTGARYGNLRSALREIECDLQRRMMELLNQHGARIVSEKEVDVSTTPVIELAAEIRKKYAS
jgi:hypothetical protein